MALLAKYLIWMRQILNQSRCLGKLDADTVIACLQLGVLKRDMSSRCLVLRVWNIQLSIEIICSIEATMKLSGGIKFYCILQCLSIKLITNFLKWLEIWFQEELNHLIEQKCCRQNLRLTYSIDVSDEFLNYCQLRFYPNTSRFLFLNTLCSVPIIMCQKLF